MCHFAIGLGPFYVNLAELLSVSFCIYIDENFKMLLSSLLGLIFVLGITPKPRKGVSQRWHVPLSG